MVKLADLFNQTIQEQLKSKTSKSERSYEGLTVNVNLPDEKELREVLTKQKSQLKPKEEESFDEFEFLLAGNTPKSKEESQEKEVSYQGVDGGYIGFVNVEAFKPDPSLTNKDNEIIIENIDIMSKSNERTEILEAANNIEGIGDKAIEIVFREAYMFDFKDKEERFKLEALVQLCSRLTVLSLKGRILIIGILQYAKNEQHIELAIRVAGQVHEKEATASILGHAKNPNLFISVLDSLLKMGDTAAVIDLLKVLDVITLPKAILEEVIMLAREFYKVSDSIIPHLFDRYVHTNNRAYRPIFSQAIKSFNTTAVPSLVDIIEKDLSPERIREASKLLGGIREPIAVDKLRTAYRKHSTKRAAIMEGIGHTREQGLADFVIEELQQADHQRLKDACIIALANVGTEQTIPYLKNYLKDSEVKLSAIFTLTQLGYSPAFDQYISTLTDGNDDEQHRLRGYAALLRFNSLTKMAEKLYDLSDSKAVSILLALQRPNVLPKEVGPIIESLLKRKISAPVRLEIYRLIAKFVNTKRQILPQKILFDAKQQEQDSLMKRELEQIFKTMPKRGSEVGYDGGGR
ncbi:HEAT repeat domain-containing protein [Litchfieldia alkalitelluris]|uniref:HEAT repeat domain-containing protein n=1 Tax=Litchfieldia alkalitelluris TaxID=304268 RepID=UPI0009979D88|nr:HEAT repeat domain-containing protein [Litchfieldia alkalitelluris]